MRIMPISIGKKNARERLLYMCVPFRYMFCFQYMKSLHRSVFGISVMPSLSYILAFFLFHGGLFPICSQVRVLEERGILVFTSTAVLLSYCYLQLLLLLLLSYSFQCSLNTNFLHRCVYIEYRIFFDTRIIMICLCYLFFHCDFPKQLT